MRASPTVAQLVRSCSVAAVLASTAPAAVHAQDWLALMPECAYGPEARAPGHMALLYPRAGLPALVHAGEVLVARVRVPSGLTPPPGVQQDRALVGWAAALRGDGLPVDEPARHLYPLRVTDVRPDGPSSLVYRASVRIPRWAAPGTYALRMSAPGGHDAVPAAVRVLRGDELPRVALLGSLGDATAAQARRMLGRLARLPVDVWIGRDAPALRAAVDRAAATPDPLAPLPPLLLLGDAGPPIVLRTGATAVVLGRCDGPTQRFDERLAGLLAHRGLERRDLSVSDLPLSGLWALWGQRPRRLPAGAGLRVRRDDAGMRLSTNGDEVVLTLLLPEDGRATTVEGAQGEWWPATPVRAVGSVPTVALRLRLGPRARVRVRRARAEGMPLSVQASSTRVAAGTPVALRARSAGSVARLCWWLGEDRTAVGARVQASWRRVGAHRVHLLAIDPRGLTGRATARVRVVTRQAGGCERCGVVGPAGAGPGARWYVTWWGLVAVLDTFRRRRGNRRPRRNR